MEILLGIVIVTLRLYTYIVITVLEIPDVTVNAEDVLLVIPKVVRSRISVLL
jgi:hypothetical protein